MRGGQTTKEQDAEPNRWDHPRLTVLATFLKTFVFDYQYEDFGGGHRARRCDSHKPFLQLDGEIGLILRVLIIMQSQCSSTPPGHVAAFQAGNCAKGDPETFNRFPFGPT
jgi:hypothetical protein